MGPASFARVSGASTICKETSRASEQTVLTLAFVLLRLVAPGLPDRLDRLDRPDRPELPPRPDRLELLDLCVLPTKGLETSVRAVSATRRV